MLPSGNGLSFRRAPGDQAPAGSVDAGLSTDGFDGNNGVVAEGDDHVHNEPLYDPDRMVLEDLAFTDTAAVRAYLDQPVTHALYEDFGREFRQLDPADQRREFLEASANYEAWRTQVADLFETYGDGTPARETLAEMLIRLDDYIGLVKLRLVELDDEE